MGVETLLAVISAKHFAGRGIHAFHLYNLRFPIQILDSRKQTRLPVVLLSEMSPS